MAGTAVLWFRNDLRLRDNQLFQYPQVRAANSLVALFCIDPRHLQHSRWGNHLRLGSHRARFLAESLIELDESLKTLGSKLTLVAGRPEDIIPSLLGERGVLAYQQEDTYEEQRVENQVLENVGPHVTLLQHRHQTLLNRDDLGWNPCMFLPMPFGKYWHGECQSIQPRPELPMVSKGDLPMALAEDRGMMASAVPVTLRELLRQMGVQANNPASEGEFVWRGGEVAAWGQMRAYATPDGLGTHMQTRNKFHGANSFSRLSPWLANGSLSPRTVYWWVFDYFKNTRNEGGDPRFDHFHKYVFQLCWRDYFRFYCAHFGSKVFFLEGGAQKKRPWRRDADVEQRWREGLTGVPIVDALMRELKATGYISNRGRYLVASYLVFYLGIDWRIGADWFESQLLDHDVCSNYGEWASMANIAVDLGSRYPMGLKGRGPSDPRSKGRQGSGGDPWAKGAQTGDAVFDPWEQAAQYDRDEAFVRRWVPEVAHLPKGQAHSPPDLGNSYPRPLAVHAMSLPKSSALGGRDGPYGPYYSSGRQQKRANCVEVRKVKADKPAEQSFYLTLSHEAKPVRRWVVKNSQNRMSIST